MQEPSKVGLDPSESRECSSSTSHLLLLLLPLLLRSTLRTRGPSWTILYMKSKQYYTNQLYDSSTEILLEVSPFFLSLWPYKSQLLTQECLLLASSSLLLQTSFPTRRSSHMLASLKAFLLRYFELKRPMAKRKATTHLHKALLFCWRKGVRWREPKSGSYGRFFWGKHFLDTRSRAPRDVTSCYFMMARNKKCILNSCARIRAPSITNNLLDDPA